MRLFLDRAGVAPVLKLYLQLLHGALILVEVFIAIRSVVKYTRNDIINADAEDGAGYLQQRLDTRDHLAEGVKAVDNGDALQDEDLVLAVPGVFVAIAVLRVGGGLLKFTV